MEVFDLATDKLLRRIDSFRDEYPGEAKLDAVSNDERLALYSGVASGAGNERFRDLVLVNLETRRPVWHREDAFGWAAFSADSRLFAWIDEQGVNVAEVESRKLLWQSPLPAEILPDRHFRGLVFSPDCRSLILVNDGDPVKFGEKRNCLLFNVATGAYRDFGPGCRTARFSPDGRQLAKIGLTSSQVEIVDAKSGESLHVLRGLTHWVNDASYSPDGRTLATVNRDHKLRLWLAATGQELYTLARLDGDAVACHFAADGKSLAVFDVKHHKDKDHEVTVHVFRLQEAGDR